MRQPLLAAFVAALPLAGCGGGAATDTTATPAASLTIASGASITDTVLAVLSSPIVVEVRSAAGARAGVTVQFEVVPAIPSGQLLVRQTSVAGAGAQPFGPSVTIVTNAAGRAEARVQLGTITGEVRVTVRCPELGLTDTARFHVEPGLTSRIVLSLRDTVFLAGSIFTVRAFAADRAGNWTQEPVTFAAGPHVLSVNDSGRVRTESVAGRGVVRVSTVDSVRDSVRFTSFVGGRVAFLDYASDAWGTLTITDISGANPRIVLTSFALGNGSAFLAPNNDAVVFNQLAPGSTSGIGGQAAMIIDANRIERTVADPVVLPFTSYPRFGRDGQLVYLSGRTSNVAPAAIWRVRRDGTALEQLTNPTVVSGSHIMPAPSPDGDRIAYCDSEGLQVLTLSSAQRKTIGPSGAAFPDFAPDGARVAYLSKRSVHVVNADGSGDVVVAVDVDFNERPSWLPGSNWLLVRTTAGIELVEVTTGERTILSTFSAVRQIVSAP
jgi:hypothetical protein